MAVSYHNPAITPKHTMRAAVHEIVTAKEVTTMKGLTTFPTLDAAINAGYHVYDRTARGYVVRTRTFAGWALALVEPTR